MTRPIATILPLCLLLASCSMKISHRDGSVTYLGAVNIQEGDAGEQPFVHSRRIGLLVDAGATSNGIAIGYDNRLIVKPPADQITTVDYSPSTSSLDMKIE